MVYFDTDRDTSAEFQIKLTASCHSPPAISIFRRDCDPLSPAKGGRCQRSLSSIRLFTVQTD